ncbi:neuronal cell adhesion molecule-like isoform X3 [Convolutriloba macropyga]|uniref:neuronal cell adhesion molecule-like isoform X3 n=1 Tax=Convolutriloba macropyga TaxID=536237 RepID=UPI003F51DBD2
MTRFDSSLQYVRLVTATLLLSLVGFLLPGVCDAATILPFAPSIVDLPKLKAFQMSGPEFNINCTLNMQNIPTVTYRWFFSKNQYDEEGTLLRNANDGMYQITGSKLTLDNNWLKWRDLMGYYWCSATNEYGESTSSKIEVLTTRERNQAQLATEKRVQFGESSRIEFGFPPLLETDSPVEIQFAIEGVETPGKRILTTDDTTYKDGRFVIGSNGDLYVIEPRPSDSADITLQFREYGTNLDFPYKQVQFRVQNQNSEGNNNGFFPDMASIYLFVRGQPSFFTCIPKEQRTVHIRKDGTIVELPYMDPSGNGKDEIYRTDYTVFFENPQESDAGTYSCFYGSKSINYDVRVIGPPKIQCKHDDLIIRSPEENVFIECVVSSEFMELKRPTIIVNGTMERQERIRGFTLQVLGPIDGKYTVKITGERLDKYDSTVFRIDVTAQEMSKSEVLGKQGLLDASQRNQVLFNDFRVLPFEARREIILSVLSRVPIIIDPEKGQSVLVGTKDFEIKFTIFGSPVPDIRWYKDGKRIFEGQDYEMKKSNDLYFSLIIKKVDGSAVYTVEAENSLSMGIPLSHMYTLTAHEPLIMSPYKKGEVYSVVGKPLNVSCAAKQRNNAESMDIDFAWEIDEREMIPTTSNGVRMYGSRDRERYFVSTLTYTPMRIDSYLVKCTAALGGLDKVSHTIRVITGEAPETPIDLQYDLSREVFSWRSQRQDSFKTDVLEWAPMFAESDSEDTSAFKVYNETTDKLPISADTYSRGRTGSGGPFMKVELKKLTTPDKEFRPGVNYAFRAKTVNNYGPSDYSAFTYHLTSDSVPTKMIENLNIQPDQDDDSKIFVSWDLYPRDQYNSYSPTGCCIKLKISTDIEQLDLDCVDPRQRGVSTGWNGLKPYTRHYAEAWFANRKGEVATHTKTSGYNAAAAPNGYPQKTDTQNFDMPREISVNFYAMQRSDINGPFLAYKLEVFDDETGALLREELDREIGNPGRIKTITVTGLLPYTDYKLVLSVLNNEFSASSPPWKQQTFADTPAVIPVQDLLIHQTPESVHAFWLPPDRFNGEFERYETQTIPEESYESTYYQNTQEPHLDLTPYFIPSKEHIYNLIGDRFEFKVLSKNTLFRSGFTSKKFTIEIADHEAPSAPLKPYVDCVSPANNLTVSWSFKSFGKFASAHYIKYRATASGKRSGGKYRNLCRPIPISNSIQECVLPVGDQAAAYDIVLVAVNKNGESESIAEHCTSVAPYDPAEIFHILLPASKLQSDGLVQAANVPLFFAFLALVLLIVVAVLGMVYWRKNRSHPYRVREQEMKFRPKDAPSIPRKDDTARFEEYQPGLFGRDPFLDTNPRTPLMSYTPRPGGSRMDLDADSYDDDEAMMGGFDEDGSFLGAYGRGAMDAPTDLNTSV